MSLHEITVRISKLQVIKCFSGNELEANAKSSNAAVQVMFHDDGMCVQWTWLLLQFSKVELDFVFFVEFYCNLTGAQIEQSEFVSYLVLLQY